MATPAVEYHPEALDEALRAKAWYALRSASAAMRFGLAIETCIDRIRDDPRRWPIDKNNTRRCYLHGFPFAVVYREWEQRVQIIAVAHLHRKPGYWENRTASSL